MGACRGHGSASRSSRVFTCGTSTTGAGLTVPSQSSGIQPMPYFHMRFASLVRWVDSSDSR